MDSPPTIPTRTVPSSGVATSSDACWDQTGVFGNGSCAKLAQYVHCRNCPVHAQAGARLLDRPIPGELRGEWTAHFATARERKAPANLSFTLFRLGAEWLALETGVVQEVAEHRAIHSLPHRTGVVLGLANVRGELLICISLAHLLGVEAGRSPALLRREHHRLLVVGTEATRFAFPADEVHGVHRVRRDELQEPPATVARAGHSFTRGVFRWHEHTVGCLDSEAILFHLNRNLT